MNDPFLSVYGCDFSFTCFVITKLKLDKDRKAKLLAKAANSSSKAGGESKGEDVAMSNVD